MPLFHNIAIRRRHFLATTLSLAGMSLLPSVARAESVLERLKRTGTISVGVANERPYGFLETDGRLVGAVPDVIQAALESYGLKHLDGKNVVFNALIPGLNANRFDIIGTGMYINAKRCEAIAFTNPITRLGEGLAALKGNPKNIHSVADIVANSDVVVGSQTGSAMAGELLKANVPEARIVLFANSTDALSGMKAHRVDVIYFPDLELGALLDTANDPSVERVEPFRQIIGADGQPEYGYGALGLRKADTELKAALDSGITKMITSGRLLEIISKYSYGKDSVPTPGDTAESLCKK